MADIAVGGGFLKPVWDWLQKKAFLETFLWSQERYLEWKQIGRRWGSIGNLLEYSLRLENDVVPQERVPLTKIIFKKHPDCAADEFLIMIEGRRGKAKFQERIIIKGMDDSPYYFVLPNIPLMWVTVDEEGLLYRSLDDVRVMVEEAKENGRVIATNKKGEIHNPTAVDLLNDDWVEKWGKWWNLREIQHCKRHMKAVFQYKLVTVYRYPRSDEPAGNRTGRLFKLLCGLAAFSCLKHMTAPIFWVSVWIGKRRLWEEERD
ncbi:hypothetical protein [Insolitispirillum peregrinum]|uniref:Uncharacterized protein n=1 Tax=Insolitispirillum peregrinum TaxID=80876 RepID=A0A1N7PDH8_9PROT|nr:hypothetical protein [Insolitispirillum peregrinum]SIT08624.1 hypothetical protein SAMN05421779_106242 [Insolitispirillum peregrinum]